MTVDDAASATGADASVDAALGESLDPDLPLYLRLLWHGEDTGRPGPKRGVDLWTIAAAGVKIADEEGLSAVSMRKLAAELGFTTMALYRYVQSKNELLMMVVDAAYGPPANALAAEPPGSDADVPDRWRGRLTTWADAHRRVLLAHPWILQVPISEPPLTPNQVGWMEAGLAALADTPLREQEKLSSMLLIDVYVRGQTQLSVGVSMAGADSAEADRRYVRHLRALADPDGYPHVVAALGGGALDGGDDQFAVDEFAFGLESVLDGIAARIRRRG